MPVGEYLQMDREAFLRVINTPGSVGKEALLPEASEIAKRIAHVAYDVRELGTRRAKFARAFMRKVGHRSYTMTMREYADGLLALDGGRSRQ